MLNVDNPKNPTVLSLCTGYRGLERGIESVIGKCTGLAYVEIEAFAITNLVNKMETGKLGPVPIWTDLKTFDAKPFRDCVDILTGGYPCQPFSAAGKRNGEDDPRHLWPYIRTIIMDCKPRQCFLENVEGHLTLGISEVLSDLEAMGYRFEGGIFSASEVGAPHQRKRVFILAESADHRQRITEATKEERAPDLRESETKGRIESGEPSLRSERLGCDVANSRSGSSNPRENRTGRKEGSNFDRRSEQSELGNSQSDNERRLSITTMHREGVEIGGPSFYQWPSRPGEPQREWEEPRVIASRIANRHGRLANPSNSDRRTGIKGIEKEEKQRGYRSPNERRQLVNTGSEKRQGIPQPERRLEDRKTRNASGKGYPKPIMGRTADGTRNRVDRLRLLGNGVVPQTAAKAYFTLSQKLCNY